MRVAVVGCEFNVILFIAVNDDAHVLGCVKFLAFVGF